MSMRTFEGSYAAQTDEYQGQGYAEQESVSVIDRFSNFDGTFHSTRDLRVEGQAKGTIECQGTLHIAQGANVNSKVEAENITVAGELDGEVQCRGRLQILPSGRVRGKINTGTLVISEGAFYEGELEMEAPDSRLGSGRPSRPRPSRALPSFTAPDASRETTSSLPPSATGEEAPDDAPEEPPAPAPSGSNTFIRRFGGQEQSWDADEQEPAPRNPRDS